MVREAKRWWAELTKNRQLISNISVLGAVSILVKPLWFIFITVACVRFLGVNGYGELTTAMSISALALSLSSSGLEPLIVQKVAPLQVRARTYLVHFVILRLGLAGLAIILMILVALLLGYTKVLLLASIGSALYFLGLAVTELVRAAFQSFERLVLQARTVLIEKALVITCGVIALLLLPRSDVVLFAMAAGAFATFGSSIRLFLWNELLPRAKVKISWSFIRTGFYLSLPFAAVTILGTFYFRIDTVMVEAILGTERAGQYGLAFRIVEALNMLPLLVVQAGLYPRLTILARSRERSAQWLLSRIFAAALLAISVPIALALIYWAEPVIMIAAGSSDFDGAIVVLSILSLAFPLTCIRMLLYYNLIALGRQNVVAILLGLGLTVNVLFNFVLIPRVGIQGAAIATIISEITLVALYVVSLHRFVISERKTSASPVP